MVVFRNCVSSSSLPRFPAVVRESFSGSCSSDGMRVPCTLKSVGGMESSDMKNVIHARYFCGAPGREEAGGVGGATRRWIGGRTGRGTHHEAKVKGHPDAH